MSIKTVKLPTYQQTFSLSDSPEINLFVLTACHQNLSGFLTECHAVYSFFMRRKFLLQQL